MAIIHMMFVGRATLCTGTCKLLATHKTLKTWYGFQVCHTLCIVTMASHLCYIVTAQWQEDCKFLYSNSYNYWNSSRPLVTCLLHQTAGYLEASGLELRSVCFNDHSCYGACILLYHLTNHVSCIFVTATCRLQMGNSQKPVTISLFIECMMLPNWIYRASGICYFYLFIVLLYKLAPESEMPLLWWCGLIMTYTFVRNHRPFISSGYCFHSLGPRLFFYAVWVWGQKVQLRRKSLVDFDHVGTVMYTSD